MLRSLKGSSSVSFQHVFAGIRVWVEAGKRSYKIGYPNPSSVSWSSSCVHWIGFCLSLASEICICLFHLTVNTLDKSLLFMYFLTVKSKYWLEDVQMISSWVLESSHNVDFIVTMFKVTYWDWASDCWPLEDTWCNKW